MNTPPPIFVISLARATDRRENMIRRLNELGITYEITDAVDGKTLDMSQYADRLDEEFTIKKFGRTLTAGEIGCYLSHYQLWQRMIKEQIECAFILEDDACLENNFTQIIADIMSCEWQWGVVLFHAPPRRGACRIVCEIDKNHKLVQYKRHPFATVAYLINISAAKQLCGYCHKIRLPIDSAWQPYWRYNGLLYCVSPRVIKNSGEDSLIIRVGHETNTTHDIPMTVWRRIINSLIAKQERFGAWFYYTFRRPSKK